MTEPFQLHLLELTAAENEIPRRHLIAERLADLRNPERHFHAGAINHIFEIQENTGAGFGAQIDFVFFSSRRARVGMEHHVELARLGQRSGLFHIGADHIRNLVFMQLIKRCRLEIACGLTAA